MLIDQLSINNQSYLFSLELLHETKNQAMKMSTSYLWKDCTPIFILCFIFLFSIPLLSQSSSEKTYPFEIPKGQILYSENALAEKELSPYLNEHFEISDLGKTKVIESGNFVFKDYQENQISKRDTLWFAITEFRILNGDTLKSSQKMELRKINNYSIEADLRFEKNRIYIEQSPKHNSSIFAKFKKEKNTVHPTDEGLYFKIDKEEKFEFVSKSVGIGIMTIPFRARESSGEKASFFAEAKLNNVEFFLGLKIKKHSYKYGKSKIGSFSIGGFVGPGAVALDSNNSNFIEEEKVSVLGLNYGLAILGAIERVNLGVAVGVETISNNENIEWTSNNKLFFGFVCGYSLNE